MKRKPKSRTYWMHTMYGKPAAFDGRQILYWWKRAPLANSLRQIRDERAKTIAFRAELGVADGVMKYSHITVRIP